MFGDDSWRGLYRESRQSSLFGARENVRERGVQGLISIYKNRLGGLFGDRFLERTRSLKTEKNSVLFEFMFCVGNPAGVPVATRIADCILKKL